MIAAILALFTALPDIIKGITALAGWVNKKITEDPTFFTDLGNTFDALSKAQTSEEKSQSASDISMLIKRM